MKKNLQVLLITIVGLVFGAQMLMAQKRLPKGEEEQEEQEEEQAAQEEQDKQTGQEEKAKGASVDADSETAAEEPAMAKAEADADEAEEQEQEEPQSQKKSSSKKKGKDSSRSHSSPFGMAGCGLGSIIIDEKDKNSQIFASVINAYIGFVSSSITSGTSNCNYNNKQAQAEQRVYIQANLTSLEREAAVGEGMHLNALAQLFGCDHHEDREIFGAFNKRTYAKIYGTTDASVVYETLRKMGQSEKLVAKACPGLS